MSHQTSFSQQVAGNPNGARVGSARTWLPAPVGACVMGAEKLGAGFVIKLHDGHERVAFIQDIISQLDAERFLDIDNRDRVPILCAHAHPTQAYALVATGVASPCTFA